MTPSEFREVRKALHLTQVEIAARLGLHPITVSRYERGRQKIPLAIAIAAQTFRVAVGSGRAIGKSADAACYDDGVKSSTD